MTQVSGTESACAQAGAEAERFVGRQEVVLIAGCCGLLAEQRAQSAAAGMQRGSLTSVFHFCGG